MSSVGGGGGEPTRVAAMADEDGDRRRGSGGGAREDDAVDGDLSRFAKFKRRVVRDYLKASGGSMRSRAAPRVAPAT